MLQLGSTVRRTAGPASVIGVITAIRGEWYEVLWPNGEMARYRAAELVEVTTERIR